ncbi:MULTISPECIES: glycosyltransferase 61 family protein [unclassified Caballeronia]|uniref:glycosyltransferase family 61 protein n=1 Tax=unclassified Caballeronia TaxID=2646786 RepID=UPI00202903BC
MIDILFDADWYLEENPDVKAAGLSPLGHYLRFGAKELRSPSVLFDARYYIEQKPAAASLNITPLEDFLAVGGFEGCNPNPHFDSAWYLDEYEDARLSGLNPLLHYLTDGERRGYWACPHFNPSQYIAEHPDVLGSGVRPLAHFLTTRPVAPDKKAASSSDFRHVAPLRRYLRSIVPGPQPTQLSIELRVSSVEDAARSDRPHSEQLHVTPFDRSVEGIERNVAFPGQPYVARIANALVVAGTRFVITESNVILHDEEAHFCDDVSAATKSPLAQRRPRGRLALQFGARPATWIDAGINVMHEYSNNYFHFIAETMPRIMLANEVDVPADVPFLFEDGLLPNLRSLIELVNCGKRPVIFLEPRTLYSVTDMYLPADVTSVPDAYYGGPIARQSVLDVKRIRQAVNVCIEQMKFGSARSGRRIYVGRGGNLRVLKNQREIEARLAEEGFEILRVDDLGVETQIRIFRQASVIIAPTGAQITNIVWCRPSTKVVVLASDHPSHQLYLWELLGRVSGASVQTLLGPRTFARDGRYGVHDDYTVDVDAISALAKQLVSETENA